MTKLIYVDDDLPGISRKGAGKGWAYYDPEGRLITDRAEKRRLNAVALPPAYTDAWFCPAPNGHILATGIDAKGRKQYRYHPQFRAAREGEKFDSCITFGNLLPLVRKRVEDDLRGNRLTRNRAIASVVRLLDLGAVRVGNEGYARTNKSFGATTLRNRHAELTGKTLRLRYKGKGGKLREVTLSDGSLARVVRKMQDLPGQNLFKYIDDDGEQHAVGSSDVNAYLRETMGQDFTAKNCRTDLPAPGRGYDPDEGTAGVRFRPSRQHARRGAQKLYSPGVVRIARRAGRLAQGAPAAARDALADPRGTRADRALAGMSESRGSAGRLRRERGKPLPLFDLTQ